MNINQVAEQNRGNIRLEFTRQLNEIKMQYDEFTKELTETRENDQFFENDVEQLSAKLEQFKKEIHQINIHLQLTSDDPMDWSRSVRVEKPVVSHLNNSQLLFERQVISLHDRNCFFLSASDTYILAYILSINRNENRLVLYNISDGSELCYHELDVRFGNVCDMIYTEKLNCCFLAVCRQVILIYNPQRKMLTILSEIKPIDEHPFWSITVSSNTNDAFVSLDSNGYIERWSTETHPNWKLIKRWNTKDIIKNSDEGIRMVRMFANKNQLTIIILQQDKHWRFDSFDLNLQLIIRVGLPGDNDDAWLLTERTTSSLWYVNGSTSKQIDKYVHSACLIINDNQQGKIAEDQTSYCSPAKSSVLGSFSEPPTYVVHFLDSHLTFQQSFQICSLFGRVRIHGCHIRPATFYSV
ncbi:unnamed protein product [Rotaria socialis]|uniref:Uncharacterized protein n=1 Tax=Rotaria socialis TaxID=392032 RepID=A0A817W1V1_9BILA|nr:unnamed protein product [Rotaria socialis]CAF4435247.1 unnamed protein product [Rotaria socialis]